MDENTKQSGNQGRNAGANGGNPKLSLKPGSREARLAEALRQNLKRRKVAARQRADRDGDDAGDPAVDGLLPAPEGADTP
ncbi:hypothetical protein [Pannonibacter carbonis]|uniref:hypothetical protein n=1 Tax=Pannonibacter carbonis TaxID=2067569 RepID=UPI000D0FBD30|nr:hypothetical protein [Pannonibacter carbonis]